MTIKRVHYKFVFFQNLFFMLINPHVYCCSFLLQILVKIRIYLLRKTYGLVTPGQSEIDVFSHFSLFAQMVTGPNWKPTSLTITFAFAFAFAWCGRSIGNYKNPLKRRRFRVRFSLRVTRPLVSWMKFELQFLNHKVTQ